MCESVLGHLCSVSSSYKNGMAEWADNNHLRRVWRSRPRNLLRFLTAHNLAAIRVLFEEEEAKGDMEGLTSPAFTRVMLRLLGGLVVNKAELVVTILDLFASIDVNGDQRLEWPELLSYIVESGTLRGGGSGSGGDATTSEEVSTHFAARHAYRTVFSPTGGGLNGDLALAVALAGATGVGGGGGADDPMRQFSEHATFERMTHVSSMRDSCSGESMLLGLTRGSSNVYVFRWVAGVHGPVLLPHVRLRHDTALKPHSVLAALYVPEAHVVASVSRESDSGPYWVSIWNLDVPAQKGGEDPPSTSGVPHRARRIPLPAPCSLLAYNAASQWVVACADGGAAMYVIDVQAASIIASHSTNASGITAVLSVSGHLSSCVLTGSSDGSISMVDLRSGLGLPGHRVLAHEYGVRALALCGESAQLASIGSPHPQRVGGAVTLDVFNILLWEVGEWLEAVKWGTAAAATGRSTTSQAGTGEQESRGRRESSRRLSQQSSSGTGARGLGGSSSPAASRNGQVVTTPTLQHSDRPWRLLSSAKAGPRGHPTASTTAGGAASSDIDATTRPRVLAGHTAPPCALAIQNEVGVEPPHLISADEGGTVLVWSLVSGEKLQRILLYAPPRHVSARAAARRAREERGEGTAVAPTTFSSSSSSSSATISAHNGRRNQMTGVGADTHVSTPSSSSSSTTSGGACGRVATLLRARLVKKQLHGGRSEAQILQAAALGTLERSAKLHVQLSLHTAKGDVTNRGGVFPTSYSGPSISGSKCCGAAELGDGFQSSAGAALAVTSSTSSSRGDLERPGSSSSGAVISLLSDAEKEDAARIRPTTVQVSVQGARGKSTE